MGRARRARCKIRDRRYYPDAGILGNFASAQLVRGQEPDQHRIRPNAPVDWRGGRRGARHARATLVCRIRASELVGRAATTTTYTYDANDELAAGSINGATALTFAYDAYGNQTTTFDATGAATASVYDNADRLVSVTPAGTGIATTYGIDALGRTSTRTTGASVDAYSYTGSTETAWQVANTGGSGITTKSALDATGARTAVTGNALTGYLGFDLHGNTALAENASKVITDALRYDAWGVVIASTSTGVVSPWRYQGRLDVSPDAGNPLYDFGARTYRPVIGSFTSLDSYAGQAVNPLSMNRFVYAEANPATFVDPDGHAVNCNGRPCQYGENVGREDTSAATLPWAAPKPLRPSWRVRANALIADVNSRLTARDEAAEAVRSLTARYGPSDRYTIHDALDSLGLFPIVGAPADVGNALSYAGEGRWGDVGLSLIGVVPFAEFVTKGGKKVLRAADEIAEAGAKALRRLDHLPSGIDPANVRVYLSYDNVGRVQYVGITNNIERRQTEHLRTKGFRIFEVDGLGPLNRLDARSVEQAMIESYRLRSQGGTLLNALNSISPGRIDYADLIARGNTLLESAGFQ